MRVIIVPYLLRAMASRLRSCMLGMQYWGLMAADVIRNFGLGITIALALLRDLLYSHSVGLQDVRYRMATTARNTVCTCTDGCNILGTYYCGRSQTIFLMTAYVSNSRL